HTRSKRDWSSDVCSSDLAVIFTLVLSGIYQGNKDVLNKLTGSICPVIRFPARPGLNVTRRKDIVVFCLVVYSVNHFLFSSFRSVGDNDSAGYITEPFISFFCLNITPQYSLFVFPAKGKLCQKITSVLLLSLISILKLSAVSGHSPDNAIG